MNKIFIFFAIVYISPCWGGFDYITFSQQWPPAICSNSRQTCDIPRYVQSWVIHGIWPSSNGSHADPQNCDSQDKFDVDKIRDILPQLRINWPNVFADSTDESFWKHEWSKHGTCARPLPAISGEENYFSKALDLHKSHNVFDLLEMKGITPSNTVTYELDKITVILNKKIKLVCKETSEYSLLKEVHICFDKLFNLIDCPNNSTQCGRAHEILYLPYKASGHSTFYYIAVTVLIVAIIALVVAIVICLKYRHHTQQRPYAGF